MVSEEDYLKIMSNLIPEHSIERLTIPFAAVAMDLASGEEVVLTRGSLLKAVSASSAIPGILPAVRHEGRTLVDGGWVDNVPVAPAISMGAHFVIAVDAALDLNDLGPLPSSAMESLLRAHEISRIFLNNYRKSASDVLLVPKVGKMHWANFAALEPCMEAGRKAVESHMLHIQLQQQKRRAVTREGALHPGRMHHWNHAFVVI
jgi:NTE family protein